MPVTPDEFFDSPPTSGTPAEAPAGTPSQQEAPPQQARKADGTFGHKHPSFLLEQARDYGITDAEVAELTTDQLGRQINIARRLEARARHQEATRQSLEPRPAPPPAAAPPPPVEDEFPGLDEAHEPIQAAIKRINDRAKQLEKELLEEKQQRQRLQDATIESRLDDAFAGLEEHIDRIGDGPGAACKPEQMKVRKYLLDLAGVDLRNLPSERRLQAALKKAATQLFGAAPAKADPKADPAGAYGSEHGPSPKEWARGGVQRPTARKGGPEPDGDQKAVNNLTQKMREMGALPGQSRNDILNGFPD